MMSNVPKLRFKEFSGEWEVQRLEQLSSKISDGIHSTPEYNEDGDYYFVNGNNLKNGVIILDENTKRVTKEEALKHYRELTNQTILMSINGTIGNLAFYNNEDIMLGKSACYININDSLTNKHFISNQLSSSKIQYYYTSELTGSTIKNLSLKTIKNTPIQLPSKQEQEKIASFLTSVDTKIQLLTKKEELLSSYKKGVMQKIFSGEIRFKADDGSEFAPWEEKKLGDILKECKDKSTSSGQYEVLSSTKDDIVLQSEYFNREIASKDNTGYKVLRINQLVFSPQNLWLGNINVNTKYEVGIVYPSYKIYDFRESILVDYGKYFLKTPRMMYEYGQASEQGASVVRRSLNIDLFNSIKVNLPCLAEQTKIANFLSSIDSKIEQVKKQLDSTKEFKKALLQQMFV